MPCVAWISPAGAHALLASHWRGVDDSASALTNETIRIYQLHPQLTKAQALQHAMRTISYWRPR